MNITQEAQRIVRVVDNIVCNLCGNSCLNEILSDEKSKTFDFTRLDFSGTGNYASKFDECPPLKIDEVHLCDTCCIRLLAQCKIPPNITTSTGEGLIPSLDGDWQDALPPDSAE